MKKIIIFLVTSALVFTAIAGFVTPSILPADAATCTPNATKQCVSNISYWYDSCGALQSIYQNCNTTGQICQSGQCVNNPSTTVNHASKRCYNNDVFWYNSQGILQDLAQSCNDKNSCTTDSCAANACTNTLKCDGSTCAKTSTDYAKYCAGTQTQTGQAEALGLAISLFGAKPSDAPALKKSIDAKTGDIINFLLVIKNTSTLPVDGVLVKADFPDGISYTDNVKIDNLASSENITTGITLGTITPKTSKTISFTGKAQSQTSLSGQASQNPVQVIATIGTQTATYDSDYVSVNIPSQSSTAATATSTITDNNTSNPSETTVPDKAGAGSALLDSLLKNWWIILIVVAILVVVFIIIFRRLSSNA